MEEQVVLYMLFALVILLCVDQIIGLVKKIKGIPDKKHHIDVSIHIETDNKNER